MQVTRQLRVVVRPGVARLRERHVRQFVDGCSHRQTALQRRDEAAVALERAPDVLVRRNEGRTRLVERS